MMNAVDQEYVLQQLHALRTKETARLMQVRGFIASVPLPLPGTF